MTAMKPPRIAVVWRGDKAARRNATPRNNRYVRIFEEPAARGVEAEPAVFDEGFADEVGAQLLAADGVLVWVNPLQDGKDRTMLDVLLCDIARHGPWVSAHPDTILKMGTMEVLYRTRPLGWGTDTYCYATPLGGAAWWRRRVVPLGRFIDATAMTPAGAAFVNEQDGAVKQPAGRVERGLG